MKTIIKTQSYVIALPEDGEKEQARQIRALVDMLAKINPKLKVSDALLVTTDDPAFQPLLASLSGLGSEPKKAETPPPPQESEKKKTSAGLQELRQGEAPGG